MMKINKNKVFLGGTCPSDEYDFDYRKLLIPLLKEANINYFNPVVKDWTEDCIRVEEQEKVECDIHLYVITPNMKGVYSIAEMFGSLIKNYGREKRVIFGLMNNETGFTTGQVISLVAVG